MDQNKKKNKEELGKIIKTKREALSMSQDLLAQKIGVSAPTISLYESGDRSPDLDMIKKIAKVLKTPVAFFIGIDLPKADVDLALRSEKLELEDIEKVKDYIRLIKNANSKQ